MPETKLKPCPHCGGDVKMFVAPIGDVHTFACRCCKAIVAFIGADQEQKAVEAWNRRAENETD